MNANIFSALSHS